MVAYLRSHATNTLLSLLTPLNVRDLLHHILLTRANHRVSDGVMALLKAITIDDNCGHSVTETAFAKILYGLFLQPTRLTNVLGAGIVERSAVLPIARPW